MKGSNLGEIELNWSSEICTLPVWEAAVSFSFSKPGFLYYFENEALNKRWNWRNEDRISFEYGLSVRKTSGFGQLTHVAQQTGI